MKYLIILLALIQVGCGVDLKGDTHIVKEVRLMEMDAGGYF